MARAMNTAGDSEEAAVSVFGCLGFVAGAGLERRDLQVMGLTSYQLLYPAIIKGLPATR